jgi:O-antigen ligase
MPPHHLVTRARDLVAALLCVLPPLFLSNRLPTFHTVTDNKWLVVILLSACEIFLIALAWFLASRVRPGNGSALKKMLLWGIVAFAAIHLVSALLSREPGFSVRAAIPSLSLITLCGVLIWQSPPPHAIRKFVILTVATGVLIGICALAQQAGFDPLAALVRYQEAGRYRTGAYVTLGNPEYLAGYLAPLAVVALGLAMASSNRWARLAALAAAILTATPALLSGTRGSFLALAAGSLVLAIGAFAISPHLSRRARLGGLAVGGIFVVVLVAVLCASPRESRLGLLRARLRDVAKPHTESIRDRIVFNLVGLEMVARRPVAGVGPGMFGVEFYPAFLDLVRRDANSALPVFARDLNGGVAEHPHNDWLEFWAETGTLGFAGWLWILAAWAAAVARALVQPLAQPAERLLLLALASAVAALLVNALFNFPLHEPVRATLFWLALAWSASLALGSNRRAVALR